MKRRHFIKTTLFALVAAYAPISLKPLEVENEQTIALTLDLQELIGKMTNVSQLTLGKLSDIAYKHGRQFKVELTKMSRSHE